ncbi:rho-related GTP-binding protein RhoF isoform X2 [Salmo salar]|uniref:Rho-related GTP-binding protein RhoF isoform X2 n=1 Tax=Salmo salar TaxID=8030 RepID=A0A1S3LSC4_SALSA|nr:rho-related GTP-binding protein RhoF isoform X2 [Salmo salar]|eukprot:XP_013993847.1 PREDICTED: rho-related GTP-binding protein RhoF-like isoform X2 [Salmo salar]
MTVLQSNPSPSNLKISKINLNDITYCHGNLVILKKYAPSVFEKYVTTVTYGGKEIRLNLYDTAGQDDYDRLRPLSYQNANLVLVCYDVTNPTSFENVLIKWYPEVNHFCRDIPVILIGCKTDLRKDKERTRRLKAMDQAPITYTQGEETRQHMSAELYLECSAKYRENVEDIFRDATKKALASSRRARHRTKKSHCVIL